MNRKQDRRHIILTAAERLLRHYGPHKTTISDIAREASVGVGTVYLEFSSKDDILSALSTQRYSTILHTMQQASQQHTDPAEQIDALLQARFDALLKLSEEGTHAPDPLHCACDSIKHAYLRFREQEEKLMIAILQDGQQQGLFSLENPTLTARSIFDALFKFSPPWIHTNCRESLIESHTQLKKLIRLGLLATNHM